MVEGSVLTQHQSRDSEMDSQLNTRDGSLGRPGALLEISYFTNGFAVRNNLQHYFRSWEDDE